MPRQSRTKSRSRSNGSISSVHADKLTPEKLLAKGLEIVKLCREECDAGAEVRPSSFAVHLPEDPRGALTSINFGPKGEVAYDDYRMSLWLATDGGRRSSFDRLVTIANRFLVAMVAAGVCADKDARCSELKRQYLASLNSEIGGPAILWRFYAYAPVTLLGRYERFTLAGVEFWRLTSQNKAQLARTIGDELGRPAGDLPIIEDIFRRLDGRDFVATIELESSTRAAAEIQARQKLRDICDGLAGLVSLLLPQRARENDPRQAAESSILVDVSSQNGSGLEMLPGIKFDVTFLLKHAQQPLPRTVLRIMKAGPAVGGARRFITALRWLGRGHCARTEIEAFMSCAIALEALLGASKAGGIGHTLRLRCAHLVGRSRTERLRIFDQMESHYELRSNVVHANIGAVEYHKLLELKMILRSALVMYYKRGFLRRSDDQIEDWFNGRLI